MSERLVREAGGGSWGMTPLRRESLKEPQKADAAKWTVPAAEISIGKPRNSRHKIQTTPTLPAARDFVFGICYLWRRVCWARSGLGRQQLSLRWIRSEPLP